MTGAVRLATGERFALKQWGTQGPAVLLHHATGLCKEVWSEIAGPLAEHCRLFAYDVRGHGDSRAELQDLSWERYGKDLSAVAGILTERLRQPLDLVVGHSLGGIAGLLALEGTPQHFRQALLLDPVLIDADMARERKAERRKVALRTRMRRATFENAEQARAELAQHDLYGGWSARLLDDFVAHALSPTDEGGLQLKCAPSTEAAIYQLGETSVLQRLSTLQVTPELLCSHVSPFNGGYTRLRKEHPDIAITELPVSHMVPMEAPDAVRQTIARLCAVAAWEGAGT